MITCPKCGLENTEGTDFCVRCGEYLRWHPTQVTGRRPDSLPESDTPAGERQPVVDPDAVRVTLQPATPGGAATARVAPGARTAISAVVRNEDAVVDTYALRIDGLPQGWWSITPQSVHLLPFGSSQSGYEQEVVVSLHPPRVSESEARSWPFRLVATSSARVDLSGAAAGALDVERFDELTCSVRPQRRVGSPSAEYEIVAGNRGNTPVTVSLSGSDAAEILSFRIVPAQLQLGLREEWTADMRVQAAGAPPGRDLPFVVTATSELASATDDGVFVVRAPEDKRSILLRARILLTLVAATLLIVGSFATWVNVGGTALRGVCTSGPADCLNYATSLDVLANADVAGEPAYGAAAVVYFISSLGFVTILLGLVALAGLRRGRSTWIAGFLAVVLLIVLIVQADVTGGLFIPLLGGLAALVAGFLPVLESD